ncbi:MAG: hypothetical protein RMX26_07365 [Planktomarina sp.]|nr:hypothetical protein [Planktomarina sp.]
MSTLLLCGLRSAGNADEVDEAAKCAATFRILTSLEVQNEALGQHFTKLALFSYDLMGFYTKKFRNTSLTSGQTSELITAYQVDLDLRSPNGSAFLQYVRSCSGWLVKVGTLINEASSDTSDIRLILDLAPTPNLRYGYPHADWPLMQNLFIQSHRIWADMGKITPRDVRRALED